MKFLQNCPHLKCALIKFYIRTMYTALKTFFIVKIRKTSQGI